MNAFGFTFNYPIRQNRTIVIPVLPINEKHRDSKTQTAAPDPSTFTIDPILIRALRNRPQLREDFLKAIREDRETSSS